MTATLPALAFAGIGLMGLPMTCRLLAAGYPLTLWNRTPDKCAPLLELGAHRVENPAELCRDASVVMLCLANTEVVREVVFGPGGIVEGARPGQLLVDFSSLEPAATREMAAELEARTGMRWVDAPVSGVRNREQREGFKLPPEICAVNLDQAVQLPPLPDGGSAVFDGLMAVAPVSVTMPRIRSLMRRARMGSSPVVGSSKKIMWGSAAMARARPARLRIPPDRAAG